jgi:hypothetical protein
MKIFIFGSNNPTGSSFLDISKEVPILICGRTPPKNRTEEFVRCDLSRLTLQDNINFNGYIISFAPIWLFAAYLIHLYEQTPQCLAGLKGVIACSSSSFITKRFAFNDSDKQLVSKLCKAHILIKYVCQSLSISQQILAPTLVYGVANNYSDKNLTKVISLMRILPCIALPRTTGLRQPIHARQLARISDYQICKMIKGDWSNNEPEIMTLGGDSIISYKEMIIRTQDKLAQNHCARKCKIISIPDKLYFLIIFPLLLINPKFFEALLRVKSNLCDFTKVHEILNEDSSEFPILPLIIDN